MKQSVHSAKGREDMADKIHITLGSSNPHKIHEMNEIAKEFNTDSFCVEFIPLDSDNFNPVENGKTFEENAEIKALEAAKVSKDGKLFMADDSGLCVDYLNGAPGIHSARYEATAEKRIEKLLSALCGDKDRSAGFVCALCLVDKKGQIIHKEQKSVKGKITNEKRGSGGFGYDPVFLVQGLNKTMAELTEHEKNTLSHRGQAVLAMLEWLKDNFNQRS